MANPRHLQQTHGLPTIDFGGLYMTIDCSWQNPTFADEQRIYIVAHFEYARTVFISYPEKIHQQIMRPGHFCATIINQLYRAVCQPDKSALSF